MESEEQQNGSVPRKKTDIFPEMRGKELINEDMSSISWRKKKN